MTDKGYRDFDEQVRSLLGNAETEVPDGLWESISSRIPAKPVRTPATWRWAGVSLAVAAATALALVLGGTFGDRRPVTPTDEVLVAQAVPATETPEAAPEAEESVSIPADAGLSVAGTARSLNAAQPAVASHSAQEAVSGIESATTKSLATAPAESVTAVREEAPATDPAPESAAPATKPSDSGKRVSTQSPKQESWSDPFARMAYEDAHRKAVRRPSFEVKGIAGTNDKARSPFRNGYMAVSPKILADDTPSTYIKEEGESVYGIPMSFGLGVRLPLSERWAIGTGVDYSVLNRSFPGSFTRDGIMVKPSNSNIKHTLQYIGIPLNLYFDIVHRKSVEMYLFAGGAVEKGIANKYSIAGTGEPETWKLSVPGLQWSLGAGMGVQFNVTDRMGIYLDPSAKYYFDCAQPKSIRTQQPYVFNLEIGARFNL